MRGFHNNMKIVTSIQRRKEDLNEVIDLVFPPKASQEILHNLQAVWDEEEFP